MRWFTMPDKEKKEFKRKTLALENKPLSTRAMAYLTVVMLRQLTLGFFDVVDPVSFHSPDNAYHSLEQLMSEYWGIPHGEIVLGIITLASALYALFVLINPTPLRARNALGWSSLVSALWLSVFVASWIGGSTDDYWEIILWLSLIAKDATMIRDPLINPFEE